jgi:hypothetical protein
MSDTDLLNRFAASFPVVPAPADLEPDDATLAVMARRMARVSQPRAIPGREKQAAAYLAAVALDVRLAEVCGRRWEIDADGHHYLDGDDALGRAARTPDGLWQGYVYDDAGQVVATRAGFAGPRNTRAWVERAAAGQTIDPDLARSLAAIDEEAS